MNFNALSTGAKLCKKLQTYGTGQMAASGEVPNIVVINTTEVIESKKLVENVICGIRARSGLVSVHNIAGFGFLNKISTMTAKYAESFKLAAARQTEAIIKTNMADGAVIVTDCDITAAGALLGCLYANCPVLILPLGVSPSFNTRILKLNGEVAAGKINAKISEDIIRNASVPNGISNDLNSVSSFFMAAEAMGFCVPNASLNSLQSGNQLRAALSTGEQIVGNAKDLLAPKKFLTKNALSNATALILATGGDLGALHQFAKLVSANDTKIPHEFIAELGGRIPLLLDNGRANCKTIRELGGINAFWKFLCATPKLIDEQTLTASGEKLKNALAAIERVPELAAVSKTARVVLTKGGACENGGYIRVNDGTPASFAAKAWVYASLEDADKAVSSGSIPNQSIIVVQNCADINIAALAYTIEGLGKEKELALVTDGYSEKTAVLTLTIARPDSLANEEFANIQTGDVLEIDLSRGRFNTSVLAKDQKNRAKRNTIKKAPIYF